MLTKKCAVDCPEFYERRRRAPRTTGNAQNYYRTANWRSTYPDYGIDSSDTTEYKSLSERNSTSSQGSFSSIGNNEDAETLSRTPEGTSNRSSENLSDHDYSSNRSQTGSQYNDRLTETRRGHSRRLSNDPETSLRSMTSAHCSYNISLTESHCSRSSYADRRQQRSNFTDQCLSSRSSLSFRSEYDSGSDKNDSDSEIQSKLSDSELVCPELCKRDILKIPRPKTTCDSSCPKLARLDKRRKKRQARMDRYILNKGLNYFEDLCHCSLRCLLTQICMDPFMKKTVISATFFFLGIKLCFELDSWYIPL